jgi:hypothetical protein
VTCECEPSYSGQVAPACACAACGRKGSKANGDRAGGFVFSCLCRVYERDLRVRVGEREDKTVLTLALAKIKSPHISTLPLSTAICKAVWRLSFVASTARSSR